LHFGPLPCYVAKIGRNYAKKAMDVRRVSVICMGEIAMNMKLGLGAALLAASLLVGGAASAATTFDILGSATLNGNNANYNSTTVSAEFSCSLGCEGINSSATSNTNDPLSLPTVSTFTGFVSGFSDLFIDGNSSSAANEALFVKDITGVTYAATTQNTSGIVNGNVSFTTSALYILLKIGNEPNLTIIKNTGGLNNIFTYTSKAGEGSGLSHYSEFGTYNGGGGTVVPLPAGLPLMLSGLGVMAFLARRKARKA
jgi:hypothetical protein